MIKIYSKSCEYAIGLLTQLSLKDYNKNFLAADLSRKTKLPEHSSRKALQLLVGAGLLEAVTGPGGGYKLKKNPRRISLLDIIKAIDGENAFDCCVMGLPVCGTKNPCPLHHTWFKVKNKLKTEMKNKTLAELMLLGSRSG